MLLGFWKQWPRDPWELGKGLCSPRLRISIQKRETLIPALHSSLLSLHFRMVPIGNDNLIGCSQTRSNFHTSPWIILGTILIELHGCAYFGKEFPFPKCILVMGGFFTPEICCDCTIQRGIQSLIQKHEKAFRVASYQVLLLIIYRKASILNLSD